MGGEGWSSDGGPGEMDYIQQEHEQFKAQSQASCRQVLTSVRTQQVPHRHVRLMSPFLP